MKNVLNNQALEGLGQKMANAAQSGVARSKQLAEIAKLRLNNLSEEENLKRAYTEIGKLYFAEHGDAPEGAYVALCSRIAAARDNIAANNAAIAELKEREPELADVDVNEEDFADLTEAEVVQAEEATEAVAEAPEEAVVAEDVLTPDEAAPQEEPIPDEE